MYKKFVPLLIVIASATESFGGGLPPVTTTTVENDPSLFLGLSWTFGGSNGGNGSPGLSLKVLSTNERDAAALAAGVTYNFDGTVGCDLGLGYNASDATLTFGYDFCKGGVQVGLGGTTKPKSTVTEEELEEEEFFEDD